MRDGITKRQFETLEIIRSFLDSQGSSPTFKELREGLGISSDQAVFELLERLKTKGYIRSFKKARSIFLTDKANVVLGIIIPKQRASAQQGIPQRSPIELGNRKILLEKLIRVDPLLGRIYLGGLMVWEDKGNPDRIALSAHSFRELIIHLSDKGRGLIKKEEEVRMKKEEIKVRARQLERFIDPMGGTQTLTSGKHTTYDTFDKKFCDDGFMPISHHRKLIELKEYEKLIGELEEFLLRFILLTQPEIYLKIDATIKQVPEKVNPDELRLLIGTSFESYHYFYKKAGNLWLGYLNRNQFLLPNWAVGDYLARIASEKPKEVMDIIVKYRVDPANRELKNTFTIAAANMDPTEGSRIVDKINRERWLVLDQNQFSLLGHYVGDLLKHLIVGKQYDVALSLASSLLEIFKREGTTGARSGIDSYQFSEAIKNIGTIPQDIIFPFIEMLVMKLSKLCEIEHIHVSAIENHPQNYNFDDLGTLLVNAVRDLVQAHIDFLQNKKKRGIRNKILKLLGPQDVCPTIKRLRFYFYRLYPQIFLEDIKLEISGSFNDLNVWHEYFVLIRDTFGILDRGTQQKFFQMIQEGPKKNKEYNEVHLRYWKAERIRMVEQYLSPREKIKYKNLLEISLRDPDFLAPHYSWSGPNSPQKEETLAAMDINDLCEYLISWQPPKDDFGPIPSRFGLGLELSKIVKKSPQKFIANINKFTDTRIHPTYLKYLFHGFSNALKSGEVLDWSLVIPLMFKLIEKMKTEQLPVFEPSEDDEGWDSATMSIISLLTSLLAQNHNEYLECQKDKIWFIIETLSKHPDPTPAHEKEYGGDNMDPFTMSINTVRGEAFHALFTYMIWCNRLNIRKIRSGKLFVPDEVKQLAEKHLIASVDPSVAVRSVYGKYLPWLILYDRDWASQIVKDILPEKDRAMRYAAWETYLANTIYRKVYSFMRPYYELAIDELAVPVPQRKYWADMLEGLAGHIMIGLVFNVDKTKEPLYRRYFSKANGKQRGVAISFAGRDVVLGDKPGDKKTTFPDIKKMQRFWEWRLKESVNVEELKEFGWWAKENFFDNQWLLKSLLQTVKITRGIIEGEHWVVKALSKLSREYPLLCAEILNIIIRTPDPQTYLISAYKREIKNILTNVFGEGDRSAEEIGDQVVDFLTKMGLEELRYVKDSPDPSVRPAD
jgi:hypothetical protein